MLSYGAGQKGRNSGFVIRGEHPAIANGFVIEIFGKRLLDATGGTVELMLILLTFVIEIFGKRLIFVTEETEELTFMLVTGYS